MMVYRKEIHVLTKQISPIETVVSEDLTLSVSRDMFNCSPAALTDNPLF